MNKKEKRTAKFRYVDLDTCSGCHYIAGRPNFTSTFKPVANPQSRDNLEWNQQWLVCVTSVMIAPQVKINKLCFWEKAFSIFLVFCLFPRHISRKRYRMRLTIRPAPRTHQKPMRRWCGLWVIVQSPFWAKHLVVVECRRARPGVPNAVISQTHWLVSQERLSPRAGTFVFILYNHAIWWVVVLNSQLVCHTTLLPHQGVEGFNYNF